MKLRRLVLTALATIILLSGSIRAIAAAGDAFGGARSEAEKRMLFRRGAILWPVYCNTCHNARPAAEFSPAEWNMIIMHMRTQANLTGEDARSVLEYLKDSK